MKGMSEFPDLQEKVQFSDLPAPFKRNTLSHHTGLLNWS